MYSSMGIYNYEKKKSYQQANLEHIKTVKKAHYRNHYLKYKATIAAYYQRNKLRIASHYQENKEHHAAYYQANKERIKAYQTARRARIRATQSIEPLPLKQVITSGEPLLVFKSIERLREPHQFGSENWYHQIKLNVCNGYSTKTLPENERETFWDMFFQRVQKLPIELDSTPEVFDNLNQSLN